jgi:hypothetical protein
MDRQIDQFMTDRHSRIDRKTDRGSDWPTYIYTNRQTNAKEIQAEQADKNKEIPTN